MPPTNRTTLPSPLAFSSRWLITQQPTLFTSLPSITRLRAESRQLRVHLSRSNANARTINRRCFYFSSTRISRDRIKYDFERPRREFDRNLNEGLINNFLIAK